MTTVKTLLTALAAAVALLLTVVFVVHLTDGGAHEGSDAHAHLDPLDPHGAAPEIVARNALTILYAWQPQRDESTWQALHRAQQQGLLTGALAAAAATAPNPAPAPLAQWAEWKRDRAILTAAVTQLSSPTVTGDSARLEAHVTQTVLHANGAASVFRQVRVRVQLTRTEETWRVATYQEETP